MTDQQPPESGLDRLIPPEIKDDKFYRAIARIAATPGVRTVLEIGASSGGGSTEAWVAGALQNPVRPTIHCIEVSVTRFAALAERWKDHDFVRCYNVSSVPLESFPSDDEVLRFRSETCSKLRNVRPEKVLGWLQQDRDYLTAHGLSRHGIREIRAAAGVDLFDAVLIDGSEFTGKPELDETYGSRFLLLDDTKSFKNWENADRLAHDPAYRLVEKSRWTRNGYAIFEKVS